MEGDRERRSWDFEIARLPEIWEPGGTRMAAIFAEIPPAVGAPGVHLLWRKLANFPPFLEAVWPSLALDLDTTELEETAAALRTGSFISEAVGMPSHKAFRGDLVRAEIDAEFRAKIEHFNDAFQTALPRLLLAASALRAGVEGRAEPARGGRRHQPGDRSPSDAVYVPPLREGEARGKALEVLERVERGHGLPFLDDYYCALARIPEYLSAAWNAIMPIVGDPVYRERADSLVRVADDTARRLSAATAAADACRTADAASKALIRALLDAFCDRALPQTLIDVTLIKALTSGPDRATAS